MSVEATTVVMAAATMPLVSSQDIMLCTLPNSMESQDPRSYIIVENGNYYKGLYRI